MPIPTHVSQFIHSVIKKVWLEDIKKDYEDLNLLYECSLQDSFYYHLRRRLGDDFLNQYNLKLFPEYRIGKRLGINGQKADLAIVVIDPILAEEYHLEDCVTEVISVIEMKHKGKRAPEKLFDDDVIKVLSYINNTTSDTMYYVAFIREKYFYPDEVTNWLTDEQSLQTAGRLTEMYSYGDKESNSMHWGLKEYKTPFLLS